MLAIAIIFTFLFRLVGVDGNSMVPTLNHKDWLITSTVVSDYKYKDIIIAVQPGVLNEPLVKRVIATEGQWVDVDYEEGVVRVGDTKDTMVALEENYIAEPATTRYNTDTNEYPIQVPKNCVFAMGDNRNNSTDSRSYLVGLLISATFSARRSAELCQVYRAWILTNSVFTRTDISGGWRIGVQPSFLEGEQNGRYNKTAGAMVSRSYGKNKETYKGAVKAG